MASTLFDANLYITFHITPLWIWISVIAAIVTVIVLLLRKMDLLSAVCWGFMCAYMILLLAMTLFCRRPDSVSHVKLAPFWTIRELFQGNMKYLSELIVNVLMFIPVGIALCALMKGSIKKSVIAALALSVMIELLQFAGKRGLCETDDVIHNVEGALIGMAVYSLVRHQNSSGEKL